MNLDTPRVRAATAPLVFALLCGCGGENAPVALPAQVFVADERAGAISVFRDGVYDSVTTLDLAEPRDGRVVRYLPHNVQASPDGRTVWATAASWEFYSSGYAGADDEQVIVLDVERVAVVAHPAAGPARACGVRRRGALRLRDGLQRRPGDRDRRRDTPGDPTFSPGHAALSARRPGVRDGSVVFTALQDQRAVVRVTAATRAVERLALPESARGPAQVYLSPDGARLWVADQGLLTASDRVGNRVYEVDARAWAVRRSAEVGLGAHGVVVNRDGSRVYVSGAADHSVAVLDAATLALVAAVPVGRAPNGITLRDARGGMP
jgi:YVTN family beta-propeller protein